MSRVPLLVIGGFLGAGKTTLIRHLLDHNAGRRLLVLVNDFGAINIDADLIAEADGETIALTNGCLCCAMTGDLYFAVGDALDRRPRPDAIVIEASGVAEPGRIATLALAEPELEHAGIVTVADADRLPDLLDDPQVGAQVARQIAQADLIALSHTDLGDPARARGRIAPLSGAPVLNTPYGRLDTQALFDLAPRLPAGSTPPGDSVAHGALFAKWSGTCDRLLPARAVETFLSSPPPGLFRLKGWISDERGTCEVHRVGRRLDRRRSPSRPGAQVVAIGPADSFDPAEMEQRWEALLAGTE